MEGASQDGTSCMFVPQRDYEPVRDAFGVTCRDGATLQCCLLGTPAKAGGKTLLYFHGNGEVVSKVSRHSEVDGLPNFRDCVDAMLQRNLAACLLVEYRGYGANEALGPPSVTAMLDDAEDVLAALAIPDQQVVVMGRSLGTIPALHLAALHPSLGGLVIESGMARAATFVGQRVSNSPSVAHREEFCKSGLAQRLLPLEAALQHYQGPLLVLHCKDDEVFPYEDHAYLNHRAAVGQATQEASPRLFNLSDAPEAPCALQIEKSMQGGPAALCLFEYGGHNFIWPLNWISYAHAVMCLMDGTLGKHGESFDGEPNSDWWTDMVACRTGGSGRVEQRAQTSRRWCCIA